MDEEFNFEEDLKAVRRVFVEYPKLLKANEEDLKALKLEEIDLNHLVELTDFNAYEGFQYSTMIKQNRIERRRLKNQNEYLEKIVGLVKKTKIQENKINDTIGDIRNVAEVQENRWYRMKVRKDLQNSFDIKYARAREKEQKEVIK